MSKKHFVIFRNTKGTLLELPSIQFAQENSEYFKKKPETPMEINRLLVLNYGFTLIANEEKVICYKLL